MCVTEDDAYVKTCVYVTAGRICTTKCSIGSDTHQTGSYLNGVFGYRTWSKVTFTHFCIMHKLTTVSFCGSTGSSKQGEGPSALYNKRLRSYTKCFCVSAPKTPTLVVEVVSSPSRLMRRLGKEQNDSLNLK